MKNLNVLTKENTEDIVNLTSVQEGMLFHYLHESTNELYFEQMSFTIEGNLKKELLKKAWSIVAESNEMLRSIYKWEKLQKPIQIILKNYEIQFIEHDLSKISSEEKELLLEKIKEEDVKAGIDISQAPYRIILCKLEDTRYEMIVSSYHIVFDGWSNGIILKELITNYNSLVGGEIPEKQRKTKYKEFVRWVDNRDKKKQKNFWKKYLEGFQNKTILPYDNIKNQIGKAASYSESFSEELSEKIHKFSEKYSLSMASIFNFTWGLLLQKYNDTDDIMFGLTVSGRTPEIKGIENIVGLFINTIPVRMRLNSVNSILECIRKVEVDTRSKEEFENTPLSEIKSYSKANINNNENLFDSIVVVENYPLDSKLMKDSTINVKINTIFEMTNFDLTLVLSTFDTIGIRFLYDSNLFEEITIKRLVEQYVHLLEGIVQNPLRNCNQLELITENEKVLLLNEFNDTEIDYPVNKNICDAISEQAKRTPEYIAIEFKNKRLTYKELDEKSNQMARYLISKGVKQETVVGLLMDRSIDMIVSLLAVLKAGGAYLPIDVSYPEDRIIYMLENAGAGIVLTDKKTFDNVNFTKLEAFEQKDDVSIFITPGRKHIEDFNSLPVPDRSLIDITKYKNKIGMASVNNAIAIQTTRGCPYHCLYCHKIWSKNHVFRSAENIFDEINYYYKNGVRNFSIIDDCFNLNMENGEQLFKLIIKNKLKIQIFFPNGLRGDILTEDYIDLMVEAGTKGINLSLETASPRLQTLLKKNLNLDQFKKNVNYIATKHSNIILEMATMHGFPTESEEDAMMTLNFIKDIKWIHFPYIHILKIFPNTEMEEFALQQGISKEKILQSRNRAFHELPETLPFEKSFTRKYQASFLNDYFLSKERLRQVLPVQLKILDKEALIQKYNAYLPIEIKTIDDLLKFADIDDLVLQEDEYSNKNDEITIFDRKMVDKVPPKGAKKILFLDLSQLFSSEDMLYKVMEQPLGHIYLLTYLKQQFKDKIDGRIYKSGNDFDSYEELKHLIEEYQPDVIGIRCLTIFKEFFHQTVSLIRQWGITVPIFTGGPYASSDYDTILKDEHVSIVLFGEGEYTFKEIIEKMFENDFELPSEDVLKTIKGIGFAQRNISQSSSRKIILVDELSETISKEETGELESVSCANNLAYVMYTSGSTGKPKGVMVEHKQVNNSILWLQDEFNLKPQNTVVQRTNLTFDPSVWEILWPLYVGAKIKLITAEQGRNVEYLIDLMEEGSDVTAMYCPASLITGMLYMLQNRKEKTILNIPWLLIGAETIAPSTVKNFSEYFKGSIVNTYGPTECTINNTFYKIDMEKKLSIVPIGKPIANNKIYIMSKDLQLLPIKVPGEICISGDSVARGYINNIEKTKESFVKNLYTGEIMYKTGDIGRWTEEGNIEIMGRADEQVKVRGYRIELGEIKAAILKNKGIKECEVIVKEYKEPEVKVESCELCGITNLYRGIDINENGSCNICSEIDKYKYHIMKYFKTLDDLDTLLQEVQAKHESAYDCVLIYNGGKGSAYALYHLVEMGYKVLAITYNNGYFLKSDLDNIDRITRELGVDNIVLTHKNTDKMLAESLKTADTVCRGCSHISSSLVAEYAYKNGIPVVINATFSMGQIIENKLFSNINRGIVDEKEIEMELKKLQKVAPQIDRDIFAHMDMEVIEDGMVYDALTFVDFYRYCNVTNEQMLDYLNDRDEYWRSRKNYAIYSTNCPLKQVGDFYYLNQKGYHYYGGATYWEKRLGHISSENVNEDLQCNVTEKAFLNFADKIEFKHKMSPKDKIGIKVICAYTVCDENISGDDIKREISSDLPDYMIPSHIIQLDNIPLTSNGKVDKAALPEPDKEIRNNDDYEPPINQVEEAITDIWEKVLDVDAVGRNDNFFDLGGNSLLLIHMHSMIEKKYSGKISVTDLFTYTTVAKIGEVINQNKETEFVDVTLRTVAVNEDFMAKEKSESVNDQSIFHYEFDKVTSEKLTEIAQIEHVDVLNILQGIYSFLIFKKSTEQFIEIQTLAPKERIVYPVTINFSSISNFADLFKFIHSELEKKENGYKVEMIKSLNIEKEKNRIIPFIYKKEKDYKNINVLQVYDLIIEVGEVMKNLSITCEYSNRIRKDMAKWLLNNYVELVKQIIESYQK